MAKDICTELLVEQTHSLQKGGEEVVRRNTFCSLGMGDVSMPLFSDKPEINTHTQ